MTEETKNKSAAECARDRLLSEHITASTAESCTGGLIAKRLTDLPGISEVYLGGAVTYANSVKTGLIGVSPATLERVGAVSAEVAREMAAGVRAATGSDISVSTTGIAGPGGATAAKPVGLVYVGYCDEKGPVAYRLTLGETLSREEIRSRAADFALSLLAGERPEQRRADTIKP